ncbi:MAG TPA: cupin domain-containing protein [Longimicrobiaceae bacterium]|nr:cupin domain-containing protein [Longimicrobiaceae bacterium]
MSDQPADLTAGVEGHDGIFVLRGGDAWRGWNGIRYRTGLSGKNVGARQLSMNVATIPPGGVAYAHIHVDFEVMLYILEGRVRHEYGPDLQYSVENTTGDFIFIEPGVPHEVLNLSDTEPVVAVVARSDPSEWEHIIPYERSAPAEGHPLDQTEPVDAPVSDS